MANAIEQRRMRRERYQKRMLNPEENAKDRVRKIARHARAVGHFDRGPCAECGIADTVAHHPDYTRALLIVWLCRPHHAQLHRAKRLGETNFDHLERLAVEYQRTAPAAPHRHRRWGKEERSGFAELILAGASRAEIASHFGIEKSTVSTYRKRWKLPAIGRSRPAA